MKKLLLSFAMLVMALSVSAQTYKGLTVLNTIGEGMEEDVPQVIGMSPNGKYICGNTMYAYNGVIISSEDGSVVIMPTTDENGGGAELSAINNAGIAVGYDGNAISFDINGNKTYLPLSEGATANLAKGISENNIIVGSETATIVFDGENMPAQIPVYWKDGKVNRLPIPSAEDCAGSYLEELNIFGAMARYISSDAKIIVGTCDDEMGLWPVIVWRLQDDGSYAVDLTFSKKYLSAEGYATITPYSLSANGKYIGCLASQFEGWSQIITGAIYNVEEDILTFIPSNEETGEPFVPFGIADNGFAVGSDGYGMRSAAYIEPGSTTPTSLAGKYSAIELFTFLDMSGMHNLACVSADANIMAGFGSMDDFLSAPAYIINRKQLDDTLSGVASNSLKNNAPAGIYSLQGYKLNGLQSGVNIVIDQDGNAKKVLVK